MDLITAMRTFVRTVEAGSFTAAAVALGTTQPTVSKLVAGLEQHLGARLVQRSTRGLALTEDGRGYLGQARAVLEALAEAEALVGRARAAPSGLVRIGAPVAFGRLHVARRMARLLARWPELRVELLMADGFVDLLREGIDVAIRIGVVSDPGLVAKRIGTTRRVTVGAPAYLAARGEPATPADLERHNCILYTQLAAGDLWRFTGPEGPVAVRARGNYLANNSEAVREGVLAGIGIAVAPLWLFPDEIGSEALRLVLTRYEPESLPIHVVWPSHRFLPPRVRAAIDFLAEEFRLDPLLSRPAGRSDGAG